MATSPFTVEQFGPLNLIADPQEIGAGGAVDMLDADLDTLGRLRTRDGFDLFTSSALGGDVMSMAPFYTTGGTKQLVAWTSNGTYYGLNTSGASVASSSPASSTVAPMWITGGSIAVGTLDGSAAGHVMTWNGSAWTNLDLSSFVDTADKWKVIGLTPVDGRIVLSGGPTKPDRVVFSDPGGSTFTDSSWVEFSAGDGDATAGIATFRDKVIVFKGKKFAVFTGTSVDADGLPIFNYYMVNTGVGLAARFGVATAPEGVYFMGRDGIYITAGDAPVKISQAIEPLFRGNIPASYGGSAISQQHIGNTWMAMYRERLYVAVTTGAATTNNRLLVYDPKTRHWVVWSITAASLAPFRVGDDEELMFGYATGTNDVGRMFRSFTTDDGATITWSYTSGAYDLSGKNQVSVTLESALWGSGTVTLQVANDHGAADTGSAVTLGVSPAIVQGWQQIDREGTYWQHKLSGSGPATVNRLAHYISFIKPAGIG